MMDETGMWHTTVAPDGQELVTIGTPDFPVQAWGPWKGGSCDSGTENDGITGNFRVVPWHWHPEMEINYVCSGQELVTVDGKVYCLEAGQGIFIAGGVMHGSDAAPGCDRIDHVSIVFHGSLIGGAPGSVFWQKYLGAVLCAPECRCVPLLGKTGWERQALDNIRRVSEAWTAKQPGYEFTVREALSQIVLLLKENCVRHAQPPTEKELRDAERIKQMVDFVRAHKTEEITTEQIAASASISVSECLRCFRRMMNLTPKEYLRQHRIRHAVSMLEQTDKSISQIGAECGFADMSYFSRVFRAERGCTPSEYRDQIKRK